MQSGKLLILAFLISFTSTCNSFRSNFNRLIFRAKKEKSETLEVVCRVAPYDGSNACVELVEDEQLRLVPPPGQQTNRRGEPYVS